MYSSTTVHGISVHIDWHSQFTEDKIQLSSTVYAHRRNKVNSYTVISCNKCYCNKPHIIYTSFKTTTLFFLNNVVMSLITKYPRTNTWFQWFSIPSLHTWRHLFLKRERRLLNRKFSPSYTAWLRSVPWPHIADLAWCLALDQWCECVRVRPPGVLADSSTRLQTPYKVTRRRLNEVEVGENPGDLVISLWPTQWVRLGWVGGVGEDTGIPHYLLSLLEKKPH